MKGPEIRRDALNPNNITTEYMLKNSRNTQQDGNFKREREREREDKNLYDWCILPKRVVKIIRIGQISSGVAWPGSCRSTTLLIVD